MTTTLPWMPTITQMVYLENYTRNLTEIRHQAPQTPSPTSADLCALFHADRRNVATRELSVVVLSVCVCVGRGCVDTEQHAKDCVNVCVFSVVFHQSSQNKLTDYEY